MSEEKKFKLQGHLVHQGIPISIENRKGSVRSGVDKDGKPWRTKMLSHYGYIKGTKGADGEEADVYVDPGKNAPHAFVVHQRTQDGKNYDEDKILIGPENKSEAKKFFLAHYNSPKFLGPIKKVPIERLKELIDGKKPLVKVSMVAFFQELGDIFEAGV